MYSLHMSLLSSPTAAMSQDLSPLRISAMSQELNVLQMMSATQVLEFVMAVNCYSNVSVAYQILLTILVTVTSVERSFSKLKLLKNYLKSTMSQEKSNDLAMWCIEKDILDTINLDIVLNDFASRKARRSLFS